MAKRRKAGGHNTTKGRTEPAVETDSKRIINTFEDVADSEDEFFVNRDKILLDEDPVQKKRRKLAEEEALLEPSDEEVLSEPTDASLSDGEDSQDDGSFSPKLIPPRVYAQNDDHASDASDPPAEEDEDAYGWGNSRKDYYNADPITTEQDALEEEMEARRLQKKQRQGMTEADFGLDEIDWSQAGKDPLDGDAKGKPIREVLPTIRITDSMSDEEKLKILRQRYPEFEPLAKNYAELQAVYQDLSLKSSAASAVDSVVPVGGITGAKIKLNALGGYLAALCMYFALLSAIDMTTDAGHDQSMVPSELHDHKIMDTLVQCRQLWQRVKDMEIPEPEPSQTIITNGLPRWSNGDAEVVTNKLPEDQPHRPRKRKSNAAKKASRALALAQAQSEARRLDRLRQTEESLKDLSSLPALHQPRTQVSQTNQPTKSAADNDNDSDLGEATSLTPHEAAQKALRKKSLRFYTSQIAQKSNKRGAAGRDAGGDADLPYRERLKDRQERLNREAEARGVKKGWKNSAGTALEERGSGAENDNDNDNEQKHLAQTVRADGDEEYYDLVSSTALKKKQLKAAQAEAVREGGTLRVNDDQEMGTDGKRAISYAIEKNKGLTPRRKKDVRNPRVKKRKKYEDKRKKLGSVRPVWKGGEGRGGYKGEETGIKRGVVRSVKL